MATYLENLRKILSSATPVSITGDSVSAYRFSLSQISDIQNLQMDETIARYAEKGFTMQTPSEIKRKLELRLSPKILGDAIHNSASGLGTLLDPQEYTVPEMPIACSSYDSSAIYAGGGLPASILDKKSTAMILQGCTWESFQNDESFWTRDKIDLLEESAEETGFNKFLGDAIRDSYLYGGSVLYPVFKGDTPSKFLGRMDRKKLEKGCIVRWVCVDRWNTVYVPSYIPTAADYLTPKTIILPTEAIEVSTSRICTLRPKPMPYWAAICNLGWSPSDITGWITPYYAYETVTKSIPVMAQQMSLLLYRMPLDGLNAMIGVDNVDKLMQINEQQMKSWSALSPKAVNMVGEVEVVDRTYSGFADFVGAIKSDLAAQSELPEPVLWHTPNKGFSDNTQESLLKQSEMLQMRQHFIERYLSPATDCLIAHTWGTDSEEWKRRGELHIKLSKPELTTEKELADVGAKYSASVNSLVQAGFTPDIAVQTAQQFFPKVELSEEAINKIRQAYEQRVESLKMSESSITGQGTSFKQGNNRTSQDKPQKPRKPNGAGDK